MPKFTPAVQELENTFSERQTGPFVDRGGSVGFDVRAYGAVLDGASDDAAALNAALSAVQAAGVRVVTIAGGTALVGSNLTVPTGVTLRVLEGAKLKPANGVTLTINGTFDAGPYSVFDLSEGGSVVLGTGAVASVLPHWWGAVGDGVADDRAALSAADAAAAGREILLPAGTYSVPSALTITSALRVEPGAVLKPGVGVTLTLEGALAAGLYRIFDLSAGGTVAIADGAVEYVVPHWWGAMGDGVADDRAALSAADATGRAVMLPAGTYRVGSSLTLASAWQVRSGGLFRPANGVALTINGAFEAGLYQVFDTSAGGSVAFGAGAVERVLPQWWGAVGDGAADDTAAIQAAIDAVAAAGGGVIYIPEGSYRCSGLTISASNIAIVGAGRKTVLVQTANARLILASGDANMESEAALTADVSAGDETISLDAADAASLDAGDVILLRSDELVPGSSSGVTTYGELLRVRSVSGTTVTLESPARHSYTTANNARITKPRMLVGIRIENLSFSNPTPGTFTIGFLALRYCIEPKVSRIWSEGADGDAVRFLACYGGEYNQGWAYNLTDDGANNRFGYHVTVFGACRNIRISNTFSERVRHAFTTLGGAEPPGVPYDITVSDSMVVGASSAGFSPHVEGFNVVFNNCIASGGSGNGFYLRSPQTMLNNCIADGNGTGGFFVESTATQTKISNCTARNTRTTSTSNGHGFRIRGQDVQLFNCVAETNARNGILLDGVTNVEIIGYRSRNNDQDTDGLMGDVLTQGTVSDVLIVAADIADTRGALRFGSLTTNVRVLDCRFHRLSSTVVSGTIGPTIILRNNEGYTTENSGTATIANGTTSVVVPHGLSRTPTVDEIIVTPTNNLGNATKFWISAPNGNNFTINVDADPGPGTATFAWQARVL